MSIGANIRKIRLQRGMTQQELADAVLVSRPYINRVENGRIRPSSDLLPFLARALNCDINDFYLDFYQI